MFPGPLALLSVENLPADFGKAVPGPCSCMSHSSYKGENMARFAVPQNDRLLQELNRHQAQLDVWLSSAPGNVWLFVEDPASALRAAKLGIAEDILRELEDTMNGILHKLADA